MYIYHNPNLVKFIKKINNKKRPRKNRGLFYHISIIVKLTYLTNITFCVAIWLPASALTIYTPLERLLASQVIV